VTGATRLAALLALGLSAACAPGNADAERAVRAYDAALAAAYRANDPAGLASVATAREVRKVTALVDLKRAGGLVLESTLESLEVLAVAAPSRERMEVSARERWRYFDRPAGGGPPPGPGFLVVVDLDYVLVREGGAWKVDEVRGRRTEYLEPKGYAPHQAGHGARDGGATTRSP
jgi:hypothetical protein